MFFMYFFSMAFSFFKSKPATPVVRDLVWMHQAAKLQGTMELLASDANSIVAGWFPETIQYFQEKLGAVNPSITVRPVKQLAAAQVEKKTLIILEHYPLNGKEQELWANWKPARILILNALDEPLFTHFGGAQITQLMQKLGMQENECVEHKMISSSIRNAQQKLAEKVLAEHTALSAAEWFRRNIPQP